MFLECPFCGITKPKEIPKNIKWRSIIATSGVTEILIPQWLVCEHTFLIYVDKNLKVRGTSPIEHRQEQIIEKILVFQDAKEVIHIY